MTAPIAIQLYSVREYTAKDFNKTVSQIAEMGYAGIETAGFPGTTAKDAAKLFQTLGLQVCSAHSGLPVGEKKNQVLDDLKATSCTTLVCPSVSRDLFGSLEGLQKAAEMLHEAYEVCQANGIRLGYRNHYWEFQMVGGKPAYDTFAKLLKPEIQTMRHNVPVHLMLNPHMECIVRLQSPP